MAASPPAWNEEAAVIRVIPLEAVSIRHTVRPLTHVLVQAGGRGTPRRPTIAKLVVLRRLLRAEGGDLVLAADADVACALRRRGLHWVIPCDEDRSDVVGTTRGH